MNGAHISKGNSVTLEVNDMVQLGKYTPQSSTPISCHFFVSFLGPIKQQYTTACMVIQLLTTLDSPSVPAAATSNINTWNSNTVPDVTIAPFAYVVIRDANYNRLPVHR